VRGDLEDLRHRIDMLDEHLVRLLNARAACALEIGRIKREEGMDIYQPARESEVLANVNRLNTGPLGPQAIQRLFERIIDEARHLERVADDEYHASQAASALPPKRGGDETD
jgi:chorismate mutase-like protein